MSEKIVFFGSGPVAAESLRMLAGDFKIEAVITKPQPAHHRQPFPVLELAKEFGFETLTANTAEELTELVQTNHLDSKIGVIIDHGIIVSRDVIDYFPLGIVNSHFSLLPRLRGPDPISFAILNGDLETGVSLMTIVETLDEGPLIAQKSLPIKPEATTPSLTDELVTLSHKMLAESLPRYISGEVKPYPQPAAEPTYTRKLTKKDSWLDLSKPAYQLEREIRALAGWPRSRAKIGKIDVIITKASTTEGQGPLGSLWTQGKQFGFYTAQDILIIEKLIPAGKKEMPAEAFLAGYKIP